MNNQSTILSITKDKSPEFYQHYPQLFQAYFTEVDKNTLSQLSEAGYAYYHATLALDAVIDEKDLSQLPATLAFQEQSIKILTSIYGLNSTFWDLWKKRKTEYFEAIQLEKSLYITKSVSFSSYEDLADKKSAFGKVAIDALWCLSSKKDKAVYDALLSSHKYFSVGFQLYDDVKDFREDFQKGQFNWALYELYQEINFEDFGNDIQIINKMLYIRGVGQRLLQKSIDNFQKALELVNTLTTKGEWTNTILEMKQTITQYLDITQGYIKTLEVKITLKNQAKPTAIFFDYSAIPEEVIRKGLAFIQSDFEQNYVELKHIMYLSSLEGFENTEQVHVSDIFQRAMLNDCLLSVAQRYGIDIANFLNKECHYLIAGRNKDEIGAWSYFPTVKEIAADIDDLGQVMQLFYLSQNESWIEEYCTKAIEIACKDRQNSNGGIETWIIPKKFQTGIQKKQEFFNVSKWGKGPDVEVVANFIYALSLHNKHKYQDIIEKALEYINQQQSEEGFWESRWYYGNMYGAYVCLRLLKHFEDKHRKAIQKALKYISNFQNKDGGFPLSNGKQSDPLSTAFSVLTLSLFYNGQNSQVKSAKEYLVNHQQADGSWTAIDFIKPKINEPYKSKIVSTGFVLKALSQI